ncbi:MAG TPA: argininosuccinate lyase [bacterium]|jgi:argininosuccinate lyase|nr:argininosuccinate lyase [bacterium]
MGGEQHSGYRMWGGRFAGQLDPRVARFTASLPVDVRLLPHDLRGSLAHARMLTDRGIIPPEAGRQISSALRTLIHEAEAGTFPVDERAEDVHTLIEGELHRRIGEAAGWLHVARSRNDQVATAFRMWTKDAAVALSAGVTALQEALLERAARDGDALLPAYTHLQRAQPTLLAHHLLAYVAMLQRDVERLHRVYEAADLLPLGSGAAVGVSHPIDREAVAAALGFARLSANSLDATGDRDFAVELLSALALLMIHLSRWAGEIVLWATAEFRFLEFSDAISTGSSIMPQKRNPDPAELIRGKAGRVLGDLVALLATLKGLPAGYGLDLQEDKAPVFDAADTALAALEAAAVVAREVRFRPDRMRRALEDGFVTATEISDHLTRRGLPFREAHRLASQVVRYAEDADKSLIQLEATEWSTLLPGFSAQDLTVLTAALSPEGAVAAKDTPGGTAPGRVREGLRAARLLVVSAQEWVREQEAEGRRRDERLLG